MRNRVVPLSSIIQNEQEQNIQIQQQQVQVGQSSNNQLQTQLQPKLENGLTSLQKLNMFLEKMELEDQEEEQKLNNDNENNQGKSNKGQISKNEYIINVAKEQVESRLKEQKLCKICLEDTNESNNLLLTPCKCQGSIGYIHQECLKTWIVSQGYDLFAEIKCELCQEEYEMEIEISSKFVFNKICQEQKYLQLFYFFWLVFFMIGNLVAMVFLIYFKISNEDSQWGYIVIALIILSLFETAIVLLFKHYGVELFYSLFVKNWKILNFNELANNDQVEIGNPNLLQPENEMDRADQTGMAFNVNRRSLNQIRIIQSRSVLSNHIQDNQQQSNQKIPSRVQSRNQSQQGNENPKAANYSLGLNSQLRVNNSYQGNLQKKSMTLSQLKAHLGLDESFQIGDIKDKSNVQENNNDLNQRSNSDQQLLDFLKNNIDLYSHVVKAYNRMDNQFILQNNELSKNMTVEISVNRAEDSYQSQNIIQSPKLIKKGNSSKKIIHLYEQNEEEEEEEEEEEHKNNQNHAQNYQFSNQYINTPSYQIQIQHQNSLKKRSHHLIDIFKQEEQQRQLQPQKQQEQSILSNQVNSKQIYSKSNSFLSNQQNPISIQSQIVQIISPKQQNPKIED